MGEILFEVHKFTVEGDFLFILSPDAVRILVDLRIFGTPFSYVFEPARQF